MVKIVNLAPHDPIPPPGKHGLVLRRLGEDDPAALVIEVAFYDAAGGVTAAHKPDGTGMRLDEAVAYAEAQAASHHAATIYVLDRTKGQREQEVIRAHGAHDFPGDVLADTDPEDGAQGHDLRDRPHDAGFMR